MSVAVRIALVLVVVAAFVFGARLRASYRLMEDVDAIRLALRDEALAPVRGLDSIPTEESIREKALAIATARRFEASAVEVTTERNVAPTGPGARVADQMGQMPGQRDVDSEGGFARGPTESLRTTRITLRVHVHGEGFLTEVDDDLVATRQYGFAMR